MKERKEISACLRENIVYDEVSIDDSSPESIMKKRNSKVDQPFVLQSFSMLVDKTDKLEDSSISNKLNNISNHNSDVRKSLLISPNNENATTKDISPNEKDQIKNTLVSGEQKCRNNFVLSKIWQLDLTKSDTQFSYK